MTTSPIAPKLLKGAFIRFDETALAAIPQVIVFQYNPETISRKLKGTDRKPDKAMGGTADPNELAEPMDPDEDFDLALELDATDDLADPLAHPVAVVAGVADRIAAIELLMYPKDEVGLLSSAIESLGSRLGFGGTTAAIPQRREMPVVLLVWGPGRILPIKIDNVTIEEQAFNTALYPIRAKVSVSVKVLNEDYYAARAKAGRLRPAEDTARSAYAFTLKQKKGLAASNVINTLDSVLSMLPF